MASTPVAVRLADPLKARIRALAEHRRRPMHWLMREAIEQYVAREEQRESFRKEALDAWSDYQATGAACHRRGSQCLAGRTRGRQ